MSGRPELSIITSIVTSTGERPEVVLGAVRRGIAPGDNISGEVTRSGAGPPFDEAPLAHATMERSIA